MRLKIELTGPNITLDEVRDLVKQTDGWPGSSHVRPRAVRGHPTALVVEHDADTPTEMSGPST